MDGGVEVLEGRVVVVLMLKLHLRQICRYKNIGQKLIMTLNILIRYCRVK